MAYELYYHLPHSEKMTYVGKVDVCNPLHPDIRQEQYMAVFKSGTKVLRYFVTREAGPLEVVSLNAEDGGQLNKRLSNLVNVVMGSMDYPTFPYEESDLDDSGPTHVEIEEEETEVDSHMSQRREHVRWILNMAK
jgi:hypothetical protein